jgi:hypothetical protein
MKEAFANSNYPELANCAQFENLRILYGPYPGATPPDHIESNAGIQNENDNHGKNYGCTNYLPKVFRGEVYLSAMRPPALAPASDC